MSSEHDQFEDEALRRTMKRAMPLQAAPPQLQARLQQAIHGAREPAPAPQPLRIFRVLQGHRIAIAACVAGLVGGYFAYQLANPEPETPVTVAQAADLPLPQPAVYSLAQQHVDTLVQPPQPSAAEADFQAQRRALQQHLHMAMPAAELRSHGWRFLGAAACELNGQQGAHFRFSRGRDALSLFVLPRTAGAGTVGAYYPAEAITPHGKAPLLCKVQDETLLCMMGSTGARQPMSLVQLQGLMDAIGR